MPANNVLDQLLADPEDQERYCSVLEWQELQSRHQTMVSHKVVQPEFVFRFGSEHSYKQRSLVKAHELRRRCTRMPRTYRGRRTHLQQSSCNHCRHAQHEIQCIGPHVRLLPAHGTAKAFKPYSRLVKARKSRQCGAGSPSLCPVRCTWPPVPIEIGQRRADEAR